MDAKDHRPDPDLAWRRLTPGQRALLRRLAREGPLRAVRPWEMRTVRSLLARKLVRPKDRARDGRDHPGLWFLSPDALRILPSGGPDRAEP